MKRFTSIILLSCAWALPAWAQMSLLSVRSLQTQIVVNYSVVAADQNAACTFTVTDNNDGPTVHDASGTLFSGANSDLGRTVAAGFRWPTLVSGLNRTLYIGGHNETKQGSDGRWYSTALQADSDHTIVFTCPNGSLTVHAKTQNIPLDSNFPEQVIPQSNGKWVQPTVDYSMPNPTLIDQMSGALLRQFSNPIDNLVRNSGVMGTGNFACNGDTGPGPCFDTPIDFGGTAWTNPGNGNTVADSANLATTSTQNAPLFFPLKPNTGAGRGVVSPGFGQYTTEYQVTTYGSSTNGTEIARLCVTFDSGATCASYSTIDVTYSHTGTTYQPSNQAATSTWPATPGSDFSGWGGLKVRSGERISTNINLSGVSVSGSTVTIASPSIASGAYWPLDFPVGAKFQLTSCAAGSVSGYLTVASVDSIGQITVAESGLSASNCTFIDRHAGVVLNLVSPGTIHVSLQLTVLFGMSGAFGSDSEFWVCARQKVQDIRTGCDGETYTTPQTGTLCGLSPLGIYLIQDNTHRICQQSALYDVGNSGNRMNYQNTSSVNWVSANQFIMYDFSGNYWRITHIANDYHAYPTTKTPWTQQDRFVYTSFSGATSVNTQVQASTDPIVQAVAAKINSGMFSSLGLSGIVDNGSQDTILQYGSYTGGQNSMCMLCWTHENDNQLIGCQDLTGQYPHSFIQCHFKTEGSAGLSLICCTTGPASYATTEKLGGPFKAPVVSVDNGTGTLKKRRLTITSASHASPAVLISAFSDIDNLSGASGNKAGAMMNCSGGTTGWNGKFFAKKVDSNSFSLYTDDKLTAPLDSTSLADAGGSYVCDTAPPLYNIAVSAVTDAGGGKARITLDTSPGGYQAYFSQVPMLDGDPITFAQAHLNLTKQYWAHTGCSGCSSTQFDVYDDAALTIKTSLTEINTTVGVSGSGWHVLNAITCPDPSTITLPGPLYQDTGFGTAGHPKVRCERFQLDGHLCSSYPYSGEALQYPCPEDTTNKSQLHGINVGDGLFSNSHYTSNGAGNHARSYVLKCENCNTASPIVTVIRDYGDAEDFGFYGDATRGFGTTDMYGLQDPSGWTVMGVTANNNGAFDVNNLPNYYTPYYDGNHNDAVVPGSIPGTLSGAHSYQPNSVMDVSDATPAQWAAPFGGTGQNSFPIWQNNYGGMDLNAFTQSYPSDRKVGGVAPAYQGPFKTDHMTLNGSQGNGQNHEEYGYAHTLTHVAGKVWKVTPVLVASSLNIKVTPVVVHDIPQGVYPSDKSGPSSTMSDADVGKFCIVYTAGECQYAGQPTTSVGEIYIGLAQTLPDTGYCPANSATTGGLCAYPLWPGAGWQVAIRRGSTKGDGVRRLTKEFWEPPGHYEFSGSVITPDAKWAITVPMPIAVTPRYLQYEGGNWWGIRLPPWPAQEMHHNRMGYVMKNMQFTGDTGDTIRVTFGYGENGDITGALYCMSRNDACYTSASATASNPFDFASETAHPTTCSGTCTIAVPLIPNRAAFWRLERTRGGKTTLGPLQTIVVN